MKLRRNVGGRVAAALAGAAAVVACAGSLTAAAPAGAVAAVAPRATAGSGAQGSLRDVSCTSGGCTAVGVGGSSLNTLLSETRPAGSSSWTTTTLPMPSGTTHFVDLATISCVPVKGSSDFCAAVGSYEGGSNDATHTFIEERKGGKWSIASSPQPGFAGPAAGPALTGVQCFSPTSCIAVGDEKSSSSGSYVPLVLKLANGSWSTDKGVPTPANGGDLFSVSCVSATACTAVGSTLASSLDVPLVEKLSSGKWSIVSHVPGSGTLFAVSCTTVLCAAVGSVSTSSGFTPLILQETSGTWRKASLTGAPPAADYSQLAGVACVSGGTCAAAGDDTNSSSFTSTSLEVSRSAGGAWKVVTPKLANAGASGVSCTSASSCTMVGNITNPSTFALTTLVLKGTTAGSWVKS